jgi:hypothetical protein
MPTIKELLPDLNCSRGAPLGRYDKGEKPTDKRIYDRRVPINSGGYDRGGAYWGIGQSELRVSYTKDLSYIHFYWDEGEHEENRKVKGYSLMNLPTLINNLKWESSKQILARRLRNGK